MSNEEESFEKLLNSLEEIVTQLEESDLPLEESLKLFEEGIQKARFCEKILAEAEGKIEKLLQENGKFSKEPLDL